MKYMVAKMLPALSVAAVVSEANVGRQAVHDTLGPVPPGC
jgi:predicted DNA-binding protein YlxM (UPF0122 family)